MCVQHYTALHSPTRPIVPFCLPFLGLCFVALFFFGPLFPALWRFRFVLLLDFVVEALETL